MKSRNACINVTVDSDDVDEFIKLTEDPDARVRKAAIRNLCPCHLKANHARVWDRLIELAADSDANIRSHVFHTLWGYCQMLWMAKG